MNNILLPKVELFNELEKELLIKDDLKSKVFLRDKNCCQNCGLDTTRKYLEVHFKDYNLENTSLENLVTVCKDCHKISHPNNNIHNDNVIIIVLPRNRLDHIKQSELIFFLRYIYVLKMKYFQDEGIKEIPKTFSIFNKEIVSDIFTETFEYFEELLDDVEKLDEEDEDFKKLIEPINFYKFVQKYFFDDEYRIQEIEEEIIICPLFEKHIPEDYLYQLTLFNSIKIENVKELLLDFMETHEELLNVKPLFKYLKKI